MPRGSGPGWEAKKQEVAQNKKKWLRNPLEGTEDESYVQSQFDLQQK